MFERYTDRARRAVVLAQGEARMLGHCEIGTGHLLLGLAAEDGGIASLCLAALGFNLENARDALQVAIPLGKRDPPPNIPFTPALKKAMENALREALLLGHPYIGTEHLLLALLREAGGPSDGVLIAAGITPLVVRDEVMRRLGTYEQPRVTPAPRIQPRAATHPLPEHPWAWRVGRTLGLFLYVQVPGDDRKADVYAAMADTPELAGWMAAVLNAADGNF